MATSGTSKTSTERSTGDRKQAATSSGRQSGSRTATVDLPFVTATFRMPEMTLPQVRMPNRQDVDDAVQTAQPYLPSPRQAAYYGGLAALATIQLIEWPVALAIGAGTAVVQYGQSSGQSKGRSGGREGTAAATN